MLNRLLPRTADNDYRGYKPALWLFAAVVIMKSVMSLNFIVNGRRVATFADGIPLDTFTPAGAQTVIALFAIWAFAQLVICALSLAILLRYRALVPLMFAFLAAEHLGRKLILQILPIARTGTPPASLINGVLLAVMVVGLALSLGRPGGGVG
jgi:hypothetical protein